MINFELLYSITEEQLKEENNYYLYKQVIQIMTAVDLKAPEGACCGKNKTAIINKFIRNKKKYLDLMTKVQNRTIKPLWKGTLYFSTAHKQLNADLLTDEELISLIKSEQLNKKWVDMTDYKEPEEVVVETEKVDESKPVEKPVEVKKRGRRKKA